MDAAAALSEEELRRIYAIQIAALFEGGGGPDAAKLLEGAPGGGNRDSPG